MVDVVVIRDPDSSNEIFVFGEDDAVIIDIDLGRMDLRDPEEFEDWADSQKSGVESARWKDAAKLVKSVVAETADNFGHPVPAWTQD